MKQIDSSVKLGCIIILLVMILLAIGLLFFFIWRAGIIPLSFIPIPSNSSRISTGIDPKIDNNEGNSTETEYREYKFLPFDFNFIIPADWNIETTEIGGDPPSQKCLTHLISSPGDFATLEIIPMCGAYGGGREQCPDTLEYLDHDSDILLGRYPLPSENPYLPRLLYTSINVEYDSCPGLVFNDTIALKITANYVGPDSEWPRYLRELDKIVLSLIK